MASDTEVDYSAHIPPSKSIERSRKCELNARPLDTILALPEELLLEVFSQVVAGTVLCIRPKRNRKRRPHCLISLGLVCRSWRNLTLAVGILWSSIDLRMDDSEAALASLRPLSIALARSKSAKLNISLTFSPPEYGTPKHNYSPPSDGPHLWIIDRLLLESHRWFDISITSPRETLEYLLMRPRVDFPRLHSLKLWVSRPISVREEAHNVSAWNLTTLFGGQEEPANLRHLVLHKLLPIQLFPLPHLSTLNLSTFKWVTPGEMYTVLAASTSLSSLTISLILSKPSDAPIVFNTLRFPSLTNLHIVWRGYLHAFEAHDLSVINAFILPSLRSFTLEGMLSAIEFQTAQSILNRANPQLIESLTVIDLDSIEYCTPAPPECIERLLSLLRLVPNVKNLELTSGVLDILSLSFISELTIRSVVSDAPVLLPQLERLTTEVFHREAPECIHDPLVAMLRSRPTLKRAAFTTHSFTFDPAALREMEPSGLKIEIVDVDEVEERYEDLD